MSRTLGKESIIVVAGMPVNITAFCGCLKIVIGNHHNTDDDRAVLFSKISAAVFADAAEDFDVVVEKGDTTTLALDGVNMFIIKVNEEFFHIDGSIHTDVWLNANIPLSMKDEMLTKAYEALVNIIKELA